MMRHTLLGLSLLVLVVGLPTACAEITQFVTRTFVVGTSEVNVPDTIASSEPLSVHLVGFIGGNQCYFLEGIEVEREADDLVGIVAIGGFRQEGGQHCPAAAVWMDETVTVEPVPPFPVGELRVLVIQPEEEPVERTITVVPD